jgi:hypothetical protein
MSVPILSVDGKGRGAIDDGVIRVWAESRKMVAFEDGRSAWRTLGISHSLIEATVNSGMQKLQPKHRLFRSHRFEDLRFTPSSVYTMNTNRTYTTHPKHASKVKESPTPIQTHHDPMTATTTASPLPNYFRSAGVNACTILVPSLNLVLKILFAF